MKKNRVLSVFLILCFLSITGYAASENKTKKNVKKSHVKSKKRVHSVKKIEKMEIKKEAIETDSSTEEKDNEGSGEITLSSMSLYNKRFAAEILTDENGKLLAGTNINLVHPIASLTKMMTALIVLEKIEKKEIDPETTVTISKEAINLGGSISGLRIGDKVKIEDLLKCAIVKSGNDAAYTLGKHLGGTEEEFVKMMNKKAQELGMFSTKYYSASGLPPSYYERAKIYSSNRDYDVSTVSDIAKLSAEIIKYPKYLEISSQYYMKIKDGKLTLRNHNGLVAKYEGVDGLKTGFHNIGRYNVAVSVKKDGIRLICVVFGAPSLMARENEVVKILDYGYENLGLSKLERKVEEKYHKN